MTDQPEPCKAQAACHVCGTKGAQTHYGGICCVSCKMFFRRNSQFDLDAHHCVFNEKCDITINSRRACRFCRLQKCLEIGMQRELLRASHHRKEKPLPPPAILPSPQSAALSDEQWCRISNVIHLYEHKSPVSYIRNLLSNQSKQPMKMRIKLAKNNILEIITSMYQGILPFLELLPEFQSLEVYDQCELIERNLSCVGGFNGIIVFRESGVTFSEAFKNGFPSIYGSNIVDDSITVAHRTDSDLTLIKLLIPAILFSTSNSCEKPSLIHLNSIFFQPRQILAIQNLYVDVLFKYMIYRFGYFEAALRFAGLVKSFLDQSTCVIRAEAVQAHNQLMKTLVEKTETALVIQNEPMDTDVA